MEEKDLQKATEHPPIEDIVRKAEETNTLKLSDLHRINSHLTAEQKKRINNIPLEADGIDITHLVD